MKTVKSTKSFTNCYYIKQTLPVPPCFSFIKAQLKSTPRNDLSVFDIENRKKIFFLSSFSALQTRVFLVTELEEVEKESDALCRCLVYNFPFFHFFNGRWSPIEKSLNKTFIFHRIIRLIFASWHETRNLKVAVQHVSTLCLAFVAVSFYNSISMFYN